MQGATPSERRQCPYFQQSGCLLTVIENVCDIAEDTIDSFDLRYAQYADRCCCPEPFSACTEDEKDQTCKVLFEKQFRTAKDKIGDKEKLLESYNNIRHQLLKNDKSCLKYLSSIEHVQCGADVPPFTRKDHKCELLLWLYEELGFKNKKDMKENECLYDKKYRKKPKDVEKRSRPDDEDLDDNGAGTLKHIVCFFS